MSRTAGEFRKFNENCGMVDPTYFGRVIFRVLLCRYPHRLSVGALTGSVLYVISGVIAPYVRANTGFEIGDLGGASWILVGIFIFVFPTIFTRYRLSDDLETKLAAITRIVEQGRLSQAQARILYLELARQTLHEQHVSSESVNQSVISSESEL
ncbi:MAG: hypothetical protein JO001_05270 [Alphaproteobacteria bacterium]|nr:hypothetical protein [Alphaproteobacteria bacterium]